jgi:hypothetical protein
MTLSSLTGQPRRLSVNGQVYDLHPLTLDDLGQLQGWIDRHFPDPFQIVQEAISKGNYTVPQQQFLFSQALERSTRPKNLIGTPEADRLMGSMQGIEQLLLISIRKGRPEFTEADAKELYLHMGLGDLEAAFAATGVSAVMADPKEPRKTSSPTGSSASRRRRNKARTGGSSSTT